MVPQRARADTPRIVITSGEPAGIGPDICLALAQGVPDAELVIAGDPAVMRARAGARRLDLRPYDAETAPRPGAVSFLAPPLAASNVIPGRLDQANARHVLATLERAVDGCQRGEFQAMVTAPVHKGIINEASIPFSGHTEFLAERTGAALPVMMLAAGSLRVALATTHLPLSAVPAAITEQRLHQALTVLDRDLRERFAIARPRILVCGLNPHAGEGGHLGREEIDIIDPALVRLRQDGLDLVGPLPADTLFTPAHLEGADAVLAMYHDQGLPVLKYAGFGSAVNITLGLPIVRTSVDHGTALDLAGTGKASAGSLRAAVKAAIEMAGRG